MQAAKPELFETLGGIRVGRKLTGDKRRYSCLQEPFLYLVCSNGPPRRLDSGTKKLLIV